ncbi:MAG: hypothetical protein ACRDXX_04030 [Stackebrandtia sp.]
MSDAGQAQPTRTRDIRAVAAGSAALIAAALSVGQLVTAQLVGILSRGGQGDSPTGHVAEAALIVWTAASSVGLAAAIPSLRVHPVRRRRKLVLSGGAAFGAFLSVPVAAGVAAWSQMYGGGLSQPSVAWLVMLGVGLGAVVAWFVISSRAAMWSLICWLVVGWLLVLASAAAAPDTAPTIGHFDPGPAWSDGARAWLALLVLTSAAALVGAGLGVGAKMFGWGNGRGRRLRLPRLAAALVAGPLLMLTSYGLAGVSAGGFGWTQTATLAVGVVAAGAASYGLLTVLRRTCRPKASKSS